MKQGGNTDINSSDQSMIKALCEKKVKIIPKLKLKLAIGYFVHLCTSPICPTALNTNHLHVTANFQCLRNLNEFSS
jgi:hypothetical protein